MKLIEIALAIIALVQDPTLERVKKTLAKTPDDSSANLLLGIHYADKGKWNLALPHLDKVKNAGIRAAIEAEKKLDGNSFTGVEVGDAWFKALPTAGLARQACFDRMNVHYAAAFEGLDPIWKGNLKERLARIYAPSTPAKSAELPKGWGGPVNAKSKVIVSSTRVRSGSGALRFSPPGDGFSSNLIMETSLPRGTSIEFSGWISSEGSDTAKDSIKYAVLDKDRKSILGKSFIIHPDSFVWSRIGDESAIPSGSFSVRIEVSFESSKGVAWVDDLSIKVDGKEVLTGGNFER